MATSKKKKESEVITPQAVIRNEPIVEETIEIGYVKADGGVGIKTVPVSEVHPSLIPKEETGEVKFLRHLLYVMDGGGWGKHLHPMIEDRIKTLKAQ